MWPGTTEGHTDSTGKTVLGKTTTGIQIAARSPVALNNWKGSHFCIAYVSEADFIRKDKI